MEIRSYPCGCITGPRPRLCPEAERLRDAAHQAFRRACRESTWCAYDAARDAFATHYERQPSTTARPARIPAGVSA